MDESQSLGNGVGELHANISDLHDMFDDEFGCHDGKYYDKFGDVEHSGHDGASGSNIDVEMQKISTQNEGDPIDLTHEIAHK